MTTIIPKLDLSILPPTSNIYINDKIGEINKPSSPPPSSPPPIQPSSFDRLSKLQEFYSNSKDEEGNLRER